MTERANFRTLGGMDARPAVTVKAAQAVTVFAARYGLRPEELLRAADLDPAELADPDRRLPHSSIGRLWSELVARSADPDCGLHMAEWLVPEEYLDLLTYTCRSSPTLGDGYRRAARYFALLNQSVTLRVEEAGDAVHLIHSPPPYGPPQRQPVECILTMLLLQGRRALGSPFLPLRVSFAHAAPASTAEHRRIIGAPVRFLAPVSELVLPRNLCEQPQKGSDPRLCAVLLRQTEAELARLPAGQGPLDRTQACVHGLLSESMTEPSLEEVAARLRMSPRSLQRHLHAQGTSLRGVVETVRRDLALHHLAENQLAIGEIAFLLGFSEVSAFYRAFRRWTGRTPASYRRPAT